MSKRGSSGLRRAAGCIGIGVLVPFIAAVALVITWSVNNRPPHLRIPDHPMPPVNARDDFHRAYLLARQMGHRSPYDLNLPDKQAFTDANFAACAADAPPVLAAVRSALTKPFMAGPTRSFDMPEMKYYPEYREIARVLIGVAEHNRRIGRYDEAIDDLLDGAQMAAQIQHGGVLVEFLVSVAIDNMCLSHAEQLVPRLSDAGLGKTAGRLNAILAVRAPYGDVVREEAYASTAMSQTMFADSRTMRLSLSYFEDQRAFVNVPDGQPIPWDKKAEIIRFGLANKAAMLKENLDFALAYAREVDEKQYSPRPRARKPNNLLAQMSGDILFTGHRHYTADQSVLELIRTEVALERFRRRTGRYPQDLTELVPGYVRAVPADPFAVTAGAPLRYRPIPGSRGYLLYSLGNDQHDDGGAPLRFASNEGSGDIVAGRLFPRRAH